MRWLAFAALACASSGARADVSVPAARAVAGDDCGIALEIARKQAARFDARFVAARVRHGAPDEWELRVQEHGGLYFSVLIHAYAGAAVSSDWVDYGDQAFVSVRDGNKRRASLAATGWDEPTAWRLHAIFRDAADRCLQ